MNWNSDGNTSTVITLIGVSMIKIALFDLDGTLNGSKRRGEFIPPQGACNAEWLQWHQAFKVEKLNQDLIMTAAAYKKAGYKVAVVSNRDTSLINATACHLVPNGFPSLADYILRSLDDNRTPADWKVETISNMVKLLTNTGRVEVHHFDDDSKVLQRLDNELFGVRYIPHLVNFNG
jgi:hypothetical protein